MRVSINIENADTSIVNAIRAVLKTRSTINFTIKQEKEVDFLPSKRLLNAINEVENGEVVSFANHDDAIRYLNAND